MKQALEVLLAALFVLVCFLVATWLVLLVFNGIVIP